LYPFSVFNYKIKFIRFSTPFGIACPYFNSRIKKEYQTQIKTVQISTRPDTFIRNLTDTVFGNHDSFIYVTVLQGRECCEVGKWKDSIINLDSIMMERSEANLRKCDKQVKKKENGLKWTKRIYGTLILGLAGVLILR